MKNSFSKLEYRSEWIRQKLNMTYEDYAIKMHESFIKQYGKKADEIDNYAFQFKRIDKALTNWYRNVFDWKWIIKNLNGKSGLYAFYDYKENLVYIGKSVDIANRLASSLRQRPTMIDRIDYLLIDSESDTDIWELLYIAKYKPILNSDCVRDDESSVLKILEKEIDIQKFQTIPKKNAGTMQEHELIEV